MPVTTAVLLLLRVLVFVCLMAGVSFAERLPVRIFNSADGLGSSFVDFEMRDSRGFMWFCTRDGLSRFDGSRFVNYQLISKNSPPGIENIYEARDGIYWITSTGGTFRFNADTISSPNDKLPTLNAEWISGYRGTLFEDRYGNFWMGSAGLFRIEQQNGKVDLIPLDLGLPPKPNTTFSVADIAESGDGSLWVYSTWGLIRRLPDTRVVFYQDPETSSPPTGSLRMIAAADGRVWVIDGNKMFVVNPEPIEAIDDTRMLIVKPLVADKDVDLVVNAEIRLPTAHGEIFQYKNANLIDKWFGKQIFQSSDGTVWIPAENNLLEIAGGVVHVHTTSEGLPNVMSRMAEDSVGNLWIGSQSGLARLDRNGLVTFGKSDGANADRFLAINEGPDGVMYFANPDAHLNRFDGRSFETVRPGVEPNALHLWTSRMSFIDSRGDWWILTGAKLYKFSGVKNFSELNGMRPSATYSDKDGLKSSGMFQIFEDSTGAMWVSTRGADATGHGVSRLKRGEGTFVAFAESDGLPNGKDAASYAEDKNGNVWLGFYEGGIARFDGNRFKFLGLENGLPTGSAVTDLHIDARGRLWISSATGGLLHVENVEAENPVFEQMTTADGLGSNNVRTITEDRRGRIYIGTARGVDRISPDTGQIRHYSMADGLGADFVVDSHCDKNGDLWFATNNGVSRLTPPADESSFAPNIWLGGLRIAGEIQPTAELGSPDIDIGELSNWQNNLQIDFYGIDLRAGEILKYQYKLEGADQDWSTPSESRTVNFANLQPASYRFLVRAANSDGVVSETPAVLSFKILPPVWERWWFVSIVAIAMGLFIFGVYRYRVASLRQINRALLVARNAEADLRLAREERITELENVRSRIATDLHDDIGASLTQIAVLSEVAQAHAGKGNGGPPESLRKISEVSNELIGTMSDIVWAINPAKDHLGDLTQRMRRVASDLLSPKSVAVRFRSREEDKKLTVKTNVRREVFLIFKEVVNNIAKHSNAKNVDIDLEITGDLLKLRVKDDGVGFEIGPPTFEDTFSSEGPSGNGIKNMRKRASEMNGHFDIDSGPGRGTTVFLTLPLDPGVDFTVEPNIRS